MKTIDGFIEELKRISPEKRKLPLVMFLPNGLEVEPKVKILFDEGSFRLRHPMLGSRPEKMVITGE